MRKILVILLFILLLVGCMGAFSACDNGEEALVPSEGLEFRLNRDGASYMLTGLGTCVDSDVVIPSTYEGLPVTQIGNDPEYEQHSQDEFVLDIGDCPFYGEEGVTSVTIPEGVTRIGNYAFFGCTNLVSVTIPKSVEGIGEEAFGECKSLKSIVIPSGVTTIEHNAFLGCDSLVRIAVSPENTVYHSAGNCLIETADGILWKGCDTSVIPDDGSVTSIAESAFYRCQKLERITIPDSVTSIGKFAFSECESLADVVMGEGVTEICYEAFLNCTSLGSITIPSSVTKLGSYAFFRCNALTTVTYKGTLSEWEGVTIGEGCFDDTLVTKIVCSDGEKTL